MFGSHNNILYFYHNKETHPIIKTTIELGEKTAYWAEQKAESIVTLTRLDKPLKRIDSIAVYGVVKIEDTHENVSFN